MLKEKFVNPSVSKNVSPQNQMQFFPKRAQLNRKRSFVSGVNDAVNALDLSSLYAKMLSEGNPPYHPVMMLIILFIDGAYSPNISSKFVSVSDRLQYGQ